MKSRRANFVRLISGNAYEHCYIKSINNLIKGVALPESQTVWKWTEINIFEPPVVS